MKATLENISRILDETIQDDDCFSVYFTDKSGNEVRIAGYRENETYQHGVAVPYNADDKGLIIMRAPKYKHQYGPNDEGYRAIVATKVTKIVSNHAEYLFN